MSIRIKTEQRTTDPLQEACERVAAGGLDREEERVLEFLEAHVPELAASFRRHVQTARRSIMARLVASLLREDVLGFASESLDLHVFDNVFALNVPELSARWQDLIRKLNAHGLHAEQSYKLYPLAEKEYLVIPVGRRFAFRRLDVEGSVLYVDGSRVRELEHSVEVLHLIRRKEQAAEGDTQNAWVRLADELRNGSANLALGYAHQERNRRELQAQAAACGATTTLELTLARKQREAHFDASLFFEQLIVEGHNLHPGAKTKMGMEPDAVYRYAPEFGGCTDIRFVGIRRDHAEFSAAAELEREHPNALLFTEYPELETAAAKQFAELHLNLADYLFVPVHPWQLEVAVPEIYREELQQRIVVPVEGFSVPTGATSSFRTVVPLGRGVEASALKVAVNSQMTSTVRSISPNTTQNAAKFTGLITEVMRREPELAATFVPVNETAGYCFKGGGSLKSRNLSAVLRENVEQQVGPDELAIVGSALYAESPVSGRTVLVELIERMAETMGETPHAAAQRFVREYVEMALPGVLTLMIKYGIGLEGHMQNSVPVFRDGRPVRMLFRDWGGARLYGKRLERAGLAVDFYPGSVTVTEKREDMQNKVFYTVFQNHLSEIILQTCKAYDVSEETLWGEVRAVADEVFDRLEADPQHAEAVREDREALYRPEVDHKALTKMRLEPEEQGYSYACVSNPLHIRS